MSARATTRLGIFLFIGLVAGCATPYDGNVLTSITGGFEVREGPGELTIIRFGGNQFISDEKVRAYMFMRAAETAEERGSPYFIVYDTLSDAAINRQSRSPKIGFAAGKMSTLYVLFLDQHEEGAMSTESTIETYEPIVRPPEEEDS